MVSCKTRMDEAIPIKKFKLDNRSGGWTAMTITELQGHAEAISDKQADLSGYHL